MSSIWQLSITLMTSDLKALPSTRAVTARNSLTVFFSTLLKVHQLVKTCHSALSKVVTMLWLPFFSLLLTMVFLPVATDLQSLMKSSPKLVSLQVRTLSSRVWLPLITEVKLSNEHLNPFRQSRRKQ